MLRRPFLQLVGAAVASPLRLGASRHGTAIAVPTVPVVIGDVGGRLRSCLPRDWYLTSLEGEQQLHLLHEEGSARIYHFAWERHPNDGDLCTHARERIDDLRAVCDVQTLTERDLQIGGKSAVQYRASVRLAGDRPFHYVASFVDAGDRFDELIGDGSNLETILPGYRAFLEDLQYA